MKYTSHYFRDICEKNNFKITDESLVTLENYVSLLLAWNSKVNLISRKDEENIWLRHILGSIGFLFHFDIQRPSRLIDVGTGGGLPGIPIAILYPDVEVTLVDSVNKKITSVKDIISKLPIQNVKAICGRAEELSKQLNYNHAFDYVISRAVAPAKDIVRWCKGFLKEEQSLVNTQKQGKRFLPLGSILMLKGGDMEKEILDLRLKMETQSVQIHPLFAKAVPQSDFMDKKLLIVTV